MQGGFAGGRAAFGYTDQPGGQVLEVNEEQAATVRRVFALQAEHPDWTYQAIAVLITGRDGKLMRRKSPDGRDP